MLKAPLISAFCFWLFLAICLLQLIGRGVGFVPPPSSWEMESHWWHFNLLADIAVYLVEIPAWLIIVLEAKTASLMSLRIESWPPIFGASLSWLAFGLPIAAESLAVFLVSKTLCSRIHNRNGWCLTASSR
jgi:hypothetical protein